MNKSTYILLVHLHKFVFLFVHILIISS